MMQYNVFTSLKGFAMGIAEVIPGVSGGTIAFISGIYEELLNAIKSFDLTLLKLLLQGRFKEIWAKINGWFLLSLLSGMAVGIVFGIFVITWLLKNYPEPLWGFFFGLVISSAIIISKQIDGWNWIKILLLLAGAGIALFISLVTPTEGSTHPFYIFISGMIAISAFILPGVSGSFMLLLMGMYTLIIPSIKKILVEFDVQSLYIVGIFSTGCILGITGFSRILSWLFEHYRQNTFVLLTGFLIGSLYKIWPWRNISEIFDKNSGQLLKIDSMEAFKSFDVDQIKVLHEINVLPMDYWMSSPKVIATIVSIFIGLSVVFYLENKSAQKA